MDKKAPEKATPFIQELRSPAMQACKNAHAPYSRFPVGASLMTDDGQVFAGCNVENAAFGLTICAERNAAAQAVAAGVRPGEIRAMLVYTPGNVAHAPCGACRQVMHELLGEGAAVVSCCDGTETRFWSMGQLMPDPFEF